jgi:hypothetical protein
MREYGDAQSVKKKGPENVPGHIPFVFVLFVSFQTQG